MAGVSTHVGQGGHDRGVRQYSNDIRENRPKITELDPRGRADFNAIERRTFAVLELFDVGMEGVVHDCQSPSGTIA
jgi:hypothetical protein